VPVELTLTALPGIPLVQAGDDLPELIIASLERIPLRLVDGDVVVLAQKIVSKAEGRRVDLNTVVPGSEALNLAEETGKDARLLHVILGESAGVVRSRPGLVIVEHKLGFICANAGVDHSNVSGHPDGDWVLLLPEDPDASASRMRSALENHFHARLGVLVIDSHGRAWRNGTVGVAIGVAGFPAVLDLRGEPDLYGDALRVTQVGAADELAAAASIVMGQAGEGRPAVLARGWPYSLGEGSLKDILRPEEMDLFR